MRIVLLGLSLLIGTAAMLIGVWRFALSAPLYYAADGGTLWKRQMTLVHQVTYWPYVTWYGVAWNGASILDGNRNVLSSSRWIQFALWNGHGSDDVKIYELSGEDERLVYPSKAEPSSLSYENASGPITGLSVSFGTSRDDNKYIFARLPIPAETADSYRIVVTDVHGNVTEDTIPISSIKE